MCGDKNYEAKSNSKETFSDQIEEVKRKFENLAKEAKIDNMEQPKREPLADGVLPLTNEEKAELNKMMEKMNERTQNRSSETYRRLLRTAECITYRKTF